MEEYEDVTKGKLIPSSKARRRFPSWLIVGGFTLAFLLALGIGVLMGTMTSATQAASFAPVSNTNGQAQFVQFTGNGNAGPQSQNFAPGAQGQGQCESLTVSSVNGNTIVAKTASGRSVTIHTTTSTKYTQAGKTVTASAIKTGTHISVMGTHNSDSSITANSIDIR